MRSGATRVEPSSDLRVTADLVFGDKPVGSFGKLHPKVAKSFDLAGRAVYLVRVSYEFDVAPDVQPPA